jgi:hypothetical protein
MSSRFQKRHYTAVAAILRRAAARPNDSVQECLADLTQDFAALFRGDNPDFQSVKFIEATTPLHNLRKQKRQTAELADTFKPGTAEWLALNAGRGRAAS